MTRRDDDFNPRPGRIRHGNQGAKRPQSFVGEVMRAVKKAGHPGQAFKRSGEPEKRSPFGRGRRAALSLASRSSSWASSSWRGSCRHRGGQFRSVPLLKHLAYLKRDGVIRDGADARMFDAAPAMPTRRLSPPAAKRTSIISVHGLSGGCGPDGRPSSLHARIDEGREARPRTGLDWIAVDHWNTNNPHVHVLVRGRVDDGQDLVISRNYISKGFRGRVAERVTLELGPRSVQKIRAGLENELGAKRWTSLDRSLRDISDDSGGVVDLRPGSDGEDPELRRLMIGRAAKLERLGMAEQVGPAQWTLQPGLEPALHDLGIRGDIIKTMYRTMSRSEREPDVAGFALHGNQPAETVLGRLVAHVLSHAFCQCADFAICGADLRILRTFAGVEIGDRRNRASYRGFARLVSCPTNSFT